MTTIFEITKTALDTITPAVPNALAPYLAATLPDTYIVYQLINGSPAQHADDAETERENLVQVTVWDRTGLAVLPDFDGAMRTAGFMKGRERQLPKDPQTGHYGLAKEFTYLQGATE